MSNPCLPQAKGFTLIELLVTISIISLLVALLLPVMAKARTVASTAVCLNNQRSVFLASRLFAADRRNYYPITTSGYSSGYGGSPASNPAGYYHYGRHLDNGGYFQMDNGARPGLVNPAARCPERRANITTLFGLPEHTGTGYPGTMDFITSNLTGTPRAQASMMAWDPWSSPIDNTFWTLPRNPYPATGGELGRYGPYLADDIPPRKILTADAPINNISAGTTIYPVTQSVSGRKAWWDVPGGMTTLNTQGTGSTVLEGNLFFPLHSGGFNSMFFDGSGKTISGTVATPTALTLTEGSTTPNYNLYNLFRWTPAAPSSAGNAGYVPSQAYPAGFPANSGY